MKIALNKAHFPVTVLGPGRRIGLWLQGCSIHCPNCVSKDTWARHPGNEMTVAQLLSWCRRCNQGQIDEITGITISGGEPFDQPKALNALLDGLNQWRKESALELDFLCYSGYPFTTLQKRYPHLLKKLDALIPEPYVDKLPLTHLWRSSKNQRLLTFSALGEARYAPYLDAPAAASEKRIQMQVDGDRLWCIGLPDRGDMSALEAKAATQGIRFSDVSWR